MMRVRIGLLLVVASLAGCNLEQPAVEKRLYALDPTSIGSAPAAGGGAAATIRVADAAVSPPFGSRGFQYRVADQRYEPTYYDAWSADPGALVTAALIDLLESSGRWAIVLPDSTTASGAWTLEPSVESLYADVVDEGEPTAVLALRLTLLDANGNIVSSTLYQETERAESSDPSSMVKAWSVALARVVERSQSEMIHP